MANMAGTERIISNKMNYLAKHGYDITLITYEQGEHPLSFKLNSNIKVFDTDTRFFTINKYGAIKKVLEFTRLKRLFKNRLKKIVTETLPDIICCTTYSIRLLDVIVECARKNHAKTIIESHVAMNSLFNLYNTKKRNAKFYLNMISTKRDINNIGKFDELVVLTKGDATVWKNYKVPIIIPNLIDNMELSDSDCRPIYHRIISVGRLDEQKGFDLLIKAFSIVHKDNPGWHLDIYGHGPDYDNLTQSIDNLDMKEIIKIKDPTPAIYDEYKKSNFFVLSSRYEGFGLVLAEAMSCGIPCVSFNCEYGPSEIIHDGEDGLLVRNGDVEDLAKKIDWMITHEKERKEMGQRARESAKRYVIDPIMQQWINLFKDITSK